MNIQRGVHRGHWRRPLVLLIVAAVVVHAALPRLATLDATASDLKSMRWWAIAIAAAAQAASFVGYGFTIQSIARIARARVGLWFSVRLALAGAGVGVLLGGPVAFAAAIHRWLRERGASVEGATLCGWLPGLMNLAVLVALSLVGATYLLAHHALGRTQLETLAIVAGLIAVIVAGAGWVLSSDERLASVSAWTWRQWSRWHRRPSGAENGEDMTTRIVAAHASLRGRWHRPMLGAIAKVGFDVLTLYAMFLGVGQSPAPGLLIAGYALPQLVGTMTLLPGGIGVVEGGMTGLFVALGIRVPTAVVVVLAYRGLSFWAPIVVGLPLAIGFERAAHDGGPHVAVRAHSRG